MQDGRTALIVCASHKDLTAAVQVLLADVRVEVNLQAEVSHLVSHVYHSEMRAVLVGCGCDVCDAGNGC